MIQLANSSVAFDEVGEVKHALVVRIQDRKRSIYGII